MLPIAVVEVGMFQISVELEDKVGELSRVVGVLSAHDIDMKAVYVSRDGPGPSTGHARMIVTNTKKAVAALRNAGFAPAQEDVVVVALEDHPGGLAGALVALAKQGIRLRYAYGFVSRVQGMALSILGVPDPAAACRVLKDAGYALVDSPVRSIDEEDAGVLLGGDWNW